eukprot:2190440-Amphidinium_carterae.2
MPMRPKDNFVFVLLECSKAELQQAALALAGGVMVLAFLRAGIHIALSAKSQSLADYFWTAFEYIGSSTQCKAARVIPIPRILVHMLVMLAAL